MPGPGPFRPFRWTLGMFGLIGWPLAIWVIRGSLLVATLSDQLMREEGACMTPSPQTAHTHTNQLQN